MLRYDALEAFISGTASDSGGSDEDSFPSSFEPLQQRVGQPVSAMMSSQQSMKMSTQQSMFESQQSMKSTYTSGARSSLTGNYDMDWSALCIKEEPIMSDVDDDFGGPTAQSGNTDGGSSTSTGTPNASSDHKSSGDSLGSCEGKAEFAPELAPPSQSSAPDASSPEERRRSLRAQRRSLAEEVAASTPRARSPRSPPKSPPKAVSFSESVLDTRYFSADEPSIGVLKTEAEASAFSSSFAASWISAWSRQDESLPSECSHSATKEQDTSSKAPEIASASCSSADATSSAAGPDTTTMATATPTYSLDTLWQSFSGQLGLLCACGNRTPGAREAPSRPGQAPLKTKVSTDLVLLQMPREGCRSTRVTLEPMEEREPEPEDASDEERGNSAMPSPVITVIPASPR